MSRMATDFFAQSPVLALPLIALIIFAAVFVAIVIRTMRLPSAVTDANAKLPLSESDDV